MIAHRIDRRDAETITNSAVGGAAAALHHNIVLTAKIHDVPDNQKITGEPELGNERQFFFEFLLHHGADRRIALLRAKPDNRAQKRIHRVTGRDRELGKFITKILQRKRESLSQPRRVFDCFREIAKEFAHFAIAFQMSLAVLGEQFPSGIQMRVFATTCENIEKLSPVRPGVLHTVRRQDRQSIMIRKIKKLTVNAFFSAKEVSPDLYINVITTKSVD